MTFRWPQSPARMSTDEFMEWLERATPEQLESFANGTDGWPTVSDAKVADNAVTAGDWPEPANYSGLRFRMLTIIGRPAAGAAPFVPAPIDEADCFDCGLSQEDARDELQRIERSL